MVITFISDSHTKHRQVTQDLPGGDLIIHAGDFMNSGYEVNDITDFANWFDSLNYTQKVCIAGNHDVLFENDPIIATQLLSKFGKDIIYLQDKLIEVDGVKIYGSPWQPAFYDWAFNLPRNGEDLREKWFLIPNNTDILITHGPPFGHLDSNGNLDVGCELLRVRVDELKPKIHVFGHVHSGYGYKFYEGTHFINAAVLNERYKYQNKPLTVDWNPESNEIKFL